MVQLGGATHAPFTLGYTKSAALAWWVGSGRNAWGRSAIFAQAGDEVLSRREAAGTCEAERVVAAARFLTARGRFIQ